MYDHSRPHAVLLTDYDTTKGVFYCADPAKNPGRILLSESTLTGSTENEKLDNIKQIWRITKNTNIGAFGNIPNLSSEISVSEYLNYYATMVTPISASAKTSGSIQAWKLPWTDNSNSKLKLTTVSGIIKIKNKVVNHAGNVWYEYETNTGTRGFVYHSDIKLYHYATGVSVKNITADSAKLYVTWQNPGGNKLVNAGFILLDSAGNTLKTGTDTVSGSWQTAAELPCSHDIKSEYGYTLQPNTTYTAVLWATDSDGMQMNETITFTTLKMPVSSVSVSPASASLNIGKTQQLTASVQPSNASNKGVTWKSSNTAVATVSSSGVVTAKAIGTATITATAADGSGKYATATITVSCNHSSGTVTIPAVAPTCTATGLTVGKKCSACGAVTQAQTVVAAKGHTEVTDKAVAPTCLASGLTEGKHCSVCNAVTVAQKEVAAKGHTPITDPAVAATCSSTGLTEGKHCSVCGTVTQAQTVTQKLPHTEEVIPGAAPSCSATGLTDGKKCSVCGETLLAQTVIPTTEHSPVTDSAVAATCTTSGLTEGSHCGICGHTITAQQVIQAQGHNEETIPAVDATCTQSGLTAGKKCTVCGTVTQAQTTVPATGHSWSEGVCSVCGAVCDHDYGEEDGACTVCGHRCAHSYEATVTAPTCTAQGYTTYTCTVCNNSYNSDYVKELGHSWNDATCTAPKTCGTCGATEGEPNGHSHAANVTAPTCMEKGYTTYTCPCGDSYKDNYVDALGHTPDASVEENRVEATCNAAGSYDTVVYCAVCEEELSRVSNTIPKKQHDYSDTVVAPGCTTQGYTEHKCQCGDSYKDTYVDATGHSAADPVEENVKEASCTVSGTYESVTYCGTCNAELSREQKEIPAPGHKHSSTVTAPTCTEPGYTTYKCACGDTYTDDPTLATGHSMGDWEEETPAQCMTPGKSIRRCQNKGCQHFEEKELSATGHNHQATVTAPTCTVGGYTTYKCACGDTYTGDETEAAGHSMGEWYTYKEPTATEAGIGKRDCENCTYSETKPLPPKGKWIYVTGTDLAQQSQVWIDGKPYSIMTADGESYVDTDIEDVSLMVSYTYNMGDGQDIHTQYPTGMQVYRVAESDGRKNAVHIPEFNNILQYSGTSIRITGNQGIRFITSVPTSKKSTLAGTGIAGYKLVEYGTLMGWYTPGTDLLYGANAKSVAYDKAKGIDAVFNKTGDLCQFTGMLTDLELDKSTQDLMTRPYMVLEYVNAEGNTEQVVLYGGSIVRSIGYVAYQNKDVFNAGTSSYEFIWNILSYAYPELYDQEYKG